MDKVIKKLSQHNIFNACEESMIGRLCAEGREHTYPKGTILFLSGDEAKNYFLIESGWVKLYRETLDGTQAVVDILPANHIFGETSIFEDGNYPYSAEVVETAIIHSLPLRKLKTEIEKNQTLALNMLNAMARYRRRQDQEIEHRAIQNAPQRIGCFLLRLTDQKPKEGKITIHLPYDKTLVASRLGMQPETFSRALSKLKSATGIEVTGATITMDSLDQLARFSCAACSSEFPCTDLKCST